MVGGGHWLVRMEWRPAGWSVCLPLLIFPCTIKSRSSLLAPAHPGGPGKRVVKWLWWCGGGVICYSVIAPNAVTVDCIIMLLISKFYFMFYLQQLNACFFRIKPDCHGGLV